MGTIMWKCNKTLKMSDGEISFKKSNLYKQKSTFNNELCLCNEQGNNHIINERFENWKQHFTKQKPKTMAKKIEFTPEIIKDIAGICTDTEKVMKKHFPDVFEEEEEIHKAGDKFEYIHNGNIYILKEVAQGMYMLYNKKDNWGYGCALKVSDDITNKVLNKITEENNWKDVFTKITD